VTRDAFDHVFDAALVDANATLLVAAVDDAPAAYLLGTLAPMFVYGGGMGFVQELYVAEPVRRRGIGAALIAEFTTTAHCAGATVIALATSRAGMFYEALGFTSGAAYYTRRPTRPAGDPPAGRPASPQPAAAG
jgi:GNAT superfamily N-acetyltransferase